MKGAVEGRSGIVVAVVALAVVGFSVAGDLARRIGAVEPSVTIERESKGAEAAEAATRLRLQIVQRAMNGEVSSTADRLREAAALAAAASLIAVNERASTGAKGWNLLSRIAACNLLPRGASFTDQPNTLATPYGEIVAHVRSAPPGVEVLSIAKDKTAGPALIIRVASDIPGADGFKVWMSRTLDCVQLPRPFADEAEVIAAGWQGTELRAGK